MATVSDAASESKRVKTEHDESNDLFVETSTRVIVRECQRLQNMFPDHNSKVPNAQSQNGSAVVASVSDDGDVKGASNGATDNGSKPPCFFTLIDDSEVVICDISRKITSDCKDKICVTTEAFQRAGPRRYSYFDPTKVIAGIVTVGGLCPGLNNVIREITRTLFKTYNAQKVYGFIGGYRGIYSTEPLDLTLENTSTIHLQGGTILSAARGGFDEDKILEALNKLGVNQLFIIGGDGTMRGANALVDAFKIKANRPIAVIGIPKTIDNDVCFCLLFFLYCWKWNLIG